MKQFKTIANGNEYEFVCDSHNTRNGFNHECELFVNGKYEASGKCVYYNRTWEKYDYQSVMYNTISNLIEEREENLKRQFKAANGYVNLTQKRKAEFEQVLNTDSEIIELRQVKETIKEGF